MRLAFFIGIIMEINNYLEKFLEEFEYQEEAREAYRAVAAALDKNAEARGELERASEMLFVKPQDAKAIVALLASVAERISIPAYTVNFFAFATATQRLREIWREMGVSDAVARNSLRDFRFKNDECHMFTGIYGSYSDGWLIGWFKAERFAFGRLQFEVAPMFHDGSVTVGGKEFLKGSPAVGIHIPRSPDSFSPEARLEAYREAYKYFSGLFEDKEIPFTCCSWLLFPYNREILSPTSNTVSFADEFKFIRAYEGEVWIRFIFGLIYDGNPDNLPDKSSLHRGYKEYIKAGNKTGSGYGIFLFDGEKIINR